MRITGIGPYYGHKNIYGFRLHIIKLHIIKPLKFLFKIIIRIFPSTINLIFSNNYFRYTIYTKFYSEKVRVSKTIKVLIYKLAFSAQNERLRSLFYDQSYFVNSEIFFWISPDLRESCLDGAEKWFLYVHWLIINTTIIYT